MLFLLKEPFLLITWLTQEYNFIKNHSFLQLILTFNTMKTNVSIAAIQKHLLDLVFNPQKSSNQRQAHFFFIFFFLAML